MSKTTLGCCPAGATIDQGAAPTVFFLPPEGAMADFRQ